MKPKFQKQIGKNIKLMLFQNVQENSIKISIEASSIYGWAKYVGHDGISLGIESFGKSAPYKKIYEHFNLTSDNVVKLAKKILGK